MSIAFIRRALDPYRSSLLFLPNVEPELVTVALAVRRTDPPTVRTLKVAGCDRLTTDLEHKDLATRLWRLSFQSFTGKELHQQLAAEWGIPAAQLEITCKPTLEPKTKLRLPEGTSIIWPKGS